MRRCVLISSIFAIFKHPTPQNIYHPSDQHIWVMLWNVRPHVGCVPSHSSYNCGAKPTRSVVADWEPTGRSSNLGVSLALAIV